MSIPNNTLSTHVSAIRGIYQYIDDKSASFVDAETRYESAVSQKKAYQNKYSGKEFIILSIMASFVLVIPMSLLSLIVSSPLYLVTPLVAVACMYFIRMNYRTKKMPSLLKAVTELEEAASGERENLVNLIYQSHFNIKANLEQLVSDTDNDEFLEALFCEGIPPECENLVALDYMYCAAEKGFANTFADAIIHFQELKESLSQNKTEEGKKLYQEILDAELLSEYRAGIIKRCDFLKKQSIQKAAE